MHFMLLMLYYNKDIVLSLFGFIDWYYEYVVHLIYFLCYIKIFNFFASKFLIFKPLFQIHSHHKFILSSFAKRNPKTLKMAMVSPHSKPSWITLCATGFTIKNVYETGFIFSFSYPYAPNLMHLFLDKFYFIPLYFLLISLHLLILSIISIYPLYTII